MAKRKGYLTPKTFFPKKGDVFENLEEGLSYECVRNNEFIDGKTSEKIRYTLLIGRCPDVLGDVPIPMVWHENTNIEKELEEFDHIYRMRGSTQVRYDRNERGVFEEA